MKGLYLLLNLGSISFPLLFSIYKKMDLTQYWKQFLISTTYIAIPYLVWDTIFTSKQIWGFNPNYLLQIDIGNLPFEEILFFYCIPFASLFIYFIFQKYFEKTILPLSISRLLSWCLLLTALLIVIFNLDKAYTVVNFLFFALALLLGMVSNKILLQRFYVAFVWILIPFFLVNGILTGSFIDDQVVWYNNTENLGIRLGTIPVEDTAYAFSMLFLNLLVFNKLKQKAELKNLKV